MILFFASFFFNFRFERLVEPVRLLLERHRRYGVHLLDAVQPGVVRLPSVAQRHRSLRCHFRAPMSYGERSKQLLGADVCSTTQTAVQHRIPQEQSTGNLLPHASTG